MPQLETMVPEGARPAVRAIVKHHFWILAALVPLVMLPMLFAGTGSIGASIEQKQQEIDGKFSQVAQVSQVSPHPNEEWSKVIATQAEQVQQEIDGEWRRLWESQRSLRTWPEQLNSPQSKDFTTAVQNLRTNGQLPRRLLQRYQMTAPTLVQKLPERMGAPTAELAAAGGDATLSGRLAGGGPAGPMMGPGFGPGGGPEGAAAAFIPPKLIWNPADQARIYQSFVWKAVPTTRQVVLAQEQLWVYGMFCDIIHNFTAAATGAHDSPISVVEEIAIAQDAAEPGPGGMHDGRVFVPAKPRAAASEMGMGSMDSMESGAAFGRGGAGRRGGRGMRARPGGGGSGMEGMDEMGSGMMGGGMPGAMAGGRTSGPPTDEELLSYAYVDFGGRPLTAAELMTEPGAQMTHLMPFVLRVVIDQRSIDQFLATLATNPVPIDVRQVRINAGSGSGGIPGGMGEGMGGMGMEMGGMMMPGSGGMSGFEGGMPGMGGMPGTGTARLRRHDVNLEIRGTIALATNPDDPLKVEASSEGGGFDRDEARLERGIRAAVSLAHARDMPASPASRRRSAMPTTTREVTT
jgi:hypothetical protein